MIIVKNCPFAFSPSYLISATSRSISQVRGVSARHFICVTFHLRDIFSFMKLPCATSLLRDIAGAQRLICTTFEMRGFQIG